MIPNNNPPSPRKTAYRGIEVAESVIDGPQSIIYPQAENRLHAQKAIVLFLKNVNVL